jgi:hypothetical protein
MNDNNDTIRTYIEYTIYRRSQQQHMRQHHHHHQHQQHAEAPTQKHNGGKKNTMKINKKKLRVLVITMGGERQEQIREMFRHEALSNDFEEPVFAPGVPSRSLRNRMQFLQACHAAGLVPDVEWQAILQRQQAATAAAAAAQDAADASGANNNKPPGGSSKDDFFSCLDSVVPVSQHRRRHRAGSMCQAAADDDDDCQQQQVQVQHFSVELWRKAKTINRGRSVLACVLAHLMAMKTFTTPSAEGDDDEGCLFDVLLEDNVRVPLHESSTMYSVAATSIRQCVQASRACEEETKTKCHLRYYGWLGSLENLQWMQECHIPKRAFAFQHHPCEESSSSSSSSSPPSSSGSAGNGDATRTTVVPFPTTQDIERDLLEIKEKNNNSNNNYNKQEGDIELLLTTAMQAQSLEKGEKEHDSNDDDNQLQNEAAAAAPEQANSSAPRRPPGGTPVWGAYAYWISNRATNTC